jgi:hypothetical protein
MMKKGQMTIFLVMALGLVFIIFFVLSMASRIQTSQLEEEAQDIIENMLSKSAMENYITSCLNSVTREGIEKLSKQGGRIYNYQKGSLYTEDYDYIEYLDRRSGEKYNVSYAILRQDDDFPFIYPCPFIPEPYDKFFDTTCGVSELDSLGFSFTDYYSRLGCMYTSSAETSMYSSCNFGDIFLPRLDFSDNSIKDQLENFITENFLGCVNLGFFNETLGYEIEFEEPEVVANFGDDDVNINLNFPMLVNIRGKVGQAYTNYQVSLPTRLKTLYKKIIYGRGSPFKREINKASYNMFVELRNFFTTTNMGFKATIKRGVKGVDDVLVIEDERNTFYGEPDIFLFSIQNRAPALDFINNSEDLHFDLKVSPSAGITLIPKAEDPDDDELIYTYYGWKTDYDCFYESSSATCRRIPITETLWRNPNDETVPYNKSTGSSILKLDNNDNLCQQVLGQGTGDCPYVEDINGVKYFFISVNVSDGALNDYQELLIHLETSSILPEPEIKDIFSYNLSDYSQGIYDTFTGKPVSLEDPYKMIQKGTSALSAELKWIFLNKPYEYLTTSACTILPSQGICNPDEDVSYNNFDIKNLKSHANSAILDMVTYFDELPASVVVEYSPIQLMTNPDVAGLEQVSPEYDVSLVECIPHRSSSPSWPYHIVDNPFLANHTCCTDDFQYRPSTDICFQGEQLYCGDRNDPIYNQKDDILKKTTTSYCTGNRGNICDEDNAISVSEPFKACGDKEASDIATCSACTTNSTLYENSLPPTASCEFFDKGDSFEKDVLYPIDPTLVDDTYIADILAGFCNTERRCSTSPGSNSYGPDKFGPLICQGMCDPMTGKCTYATNCFCSKDLCLDTIPDECNNIVPPRELETCTKAPGGKPYFKDQCATSCMMEDVLDVFVCKDPAVYPDSDCISCDILCDGKTKGDYVPLCSEGATYFADVCAEDGMLEDGFDGICRGDSYDPVFGSCTASSKCDGWNIGVPFDEPYIDPDTNEVSLFAAVCNSSCEYAIADPIICRRGDDPFLNNVDPICDGRQPNTPIGCNGGIFSLVCDENCQLIEDPMKICRHGGSSCTASYGCNDKMQYETWSSDASPGNEKGCNEYCQLLDCGTVSAGGYNFNIETGLCYRSTDLLYDKTTPQEQRAEKYCNNPDTYGVNIFGFERCG